MAVVVLFNFISKISQICYRPLGASLVVQIVKNLPVMQVTQADPWVGRTPWRRKLQPSLVFLPGESPWTEEPGGLQSMVLQRVGHD